MVAGDERSDPFQVEWKAESHGKRQLGAFSHQGLSFGVSAHLTKPRESSVMGLRRTPITLCTLKSTAPTGELGTFQPTSPKASTLLSVNPMRLRIG